MEVVGGFLGCGFAARLMLVGIATAVSMALVIVEEVVRDFLACGFGVGLMMFVGGFCVRSLRLGAGLFCVFFML